MKKYELFINGEFQNNGKHEMRNVINPATEEVVAQVPMATLEDVDRAVKAAKNAQRKWAKLPAIERARCLYEISSKMKENVELLVETLIQEQGKTKSGAEGEVNVAIEYLEYMAGFARRIEQEIVQSDRKNEEILVFREPIGVAVGILPWNFPVFSIVRKVGPALITGNTSIIKPSTETPLTAYVFAQLAAQTSLPKGVLNVLTGTGETVGNALSKHKDVGIISVTGSFNSGVSIMKAASENVTHVSLELGGKGPAIVMEDADIDLAVKAILDGRLINAGQACSCVERLYVQDTIADTFIKKLVAGMKKAKVGNPLEKDVEVGPMVSERQLNSVDEMLKRAVAEGGKVLCGGRRAAISPGYYYEPTILVGCRQDSEIMQEEIFGPILPVRTFQNLDEALELANDCKYGLTSFIFTQNLHAAMKAAKELEFGETYINRENFEAMQAFHAGWKKSGIGGDDGKYCIEEYLQKHVVYVDYDGSYK